MYLLATYWVLHEIYSHRRKMITWILTWKYFSLLINLKLQCVVCCLTVGYCCLVRGGILCKLWKAITDYRQKPAWGLNGDNHSEKSRLQQLSISIPQCRRGCWEGRLQNARETASTRHAGSDGDFKLQRGFVTSKTFFERNISWEVPRVLDGQKTALLQTA